MDSRRLRELRDVYVRLSHQSTGAMVGVGGGGAGKGGAGAGAEPDSGSKEATGPQTSNDRDPNNPDPAATTPEVPTVAGGSSNVNNGSSAASAAASGTLDPFNREVQQTGQATTGAPAVGTAERRGAEQAAAASSSGSAAAVCRNDSDYAGVRRRRGVVGLRNVDQFVHYPVTVGLSERNTRDGGGASASGGGSAPKRRRKGKQEGDKFYPRSYFEWSDSLMEQQLPEQSWVSFVTSIFELGLKHSSPKVLMKLMPPKADRLTTEHIKSRLQKYRLHAERSKEEFLEFFNLRLQAKFNDFVDKEGWRNLSPRHGTDDGNDVDYDAAADNGGGGVPGTVEGGGDGIGGIGGSDSEEPLAVNVDGRMVGDILDLGAQCVREQANLQDVLRHHIAAQLKLQAEIHEHLTTTTTAATAAAPPHPPPLCGTLSTASSVAAESEAGSNSQRGDKALLGSGGNGAETSEGSGHGGRADDGSR